MSPTMPWELVVIEWNCNIACLQPNESCSIEPALHGHHTTGWRACGGVPGGWRVAVHTHDPPRPGVADRQGSLPDHLVAPSGGRTSTEMAVLPTLHPHAVPPPARPGETAPHRGAALLRRRGEEVGVLGGGVVVPCARRAGLGMRGGAKAPSCSNSWRARIPTL